MLEDLEMLAIITVEAILGGDPDITIMGLQDIIDRIIGEAIVDGHAVKNGAAVGRTTEGGREETQ